MNSERKYFGTDGIRGRVGEFPITPEFVMKLGWAAGRILAGSGSGTVLIGKDTRISGYMFESALEAGLSAAGIDIGLLGPMPTPAIAVLVKKSGAQAGIVISASHNPHEDNGIKFFSSAGLKLPDEVEYAIEQEMEKPLAVVDPGKLGKARRVTDAARRYIDFCKSSTASMLDLRDLKLVIDCAHGANYQIAPDLFRELGAELITVGTEPDGININKQTGVLYPELLQNQVLENNADAGIAFDGDGDRVMMVDHRGNILDGDDLIYIIASNHRETLRGGVVGTVMSNLGLETAIQSLGLEFHRAMVGDRYIMDILQRENLVLGGETSGHIINLEKSTSGDGIISALQVLEIMLREESTLEELRSGMSKFPQMMKNVRINGQVDPYQLDGIPVLIKQSEDELGNRGRILIRTSGTEPLIRIMVEGEDEMLVGRIVNHLSSEIESAVYNLSAKQ